ncbi:putative zinc finger protein [Orchesella cincta]|uniref:Putative zinc finger protein n=1 Tax=Orchesella cincta TaxID=48709 RepID=A0A1D2ML64_ORCCI|nr:putative zinc finger protein [Orchesella cincta]
MERRQRWLEAQFRRHDEGLSKIAKQLQVLQDFISLNFDSFRQYAVERERVDSISHLTYGNLDKEHHHHHLSQQTQSYGSPVAHSHHHVHLHSSSRLTPIPGPDHYPTRHSSRHHHHNANNNNNNSDSEYDDGDSMDPAPEGDPPPSTGVGGGGSHSIMDLSTERHAQQQHCYQQQQEPNSTVSEYSAAAYYQVAVPDSVMMDEGPTDLSTERKSFKMQHSASSTGSISPPYHPNAQGSILGGILTSHIQPKIKAEIKEEEEPSQCYAYPRSRTDSIDSISKDKEYNAQSLWSAGTMTTIAGPGSACSTDEISVSPEQIVHRSKPRNAMEDGSKADKAMDFQNFLLADTIGDGVGENCDSKMGKKISSCTAAAVSTYSPGSSYRNNNNRRNSIGESIVTPSSTAILPHKSPSTSTSTSTCSSGEHSSSTTTTTGSGRKGSRGESGNSASNASKQCRYCGKTFQWLHSVKTHERLHTGNFYSMIYHISLENPIT